MKPLIRNARRLAPFALAGVACGCQPDSRVFGGAVTGTVLDSSAQPAGFITVYLVDAAGRKPGHSDALSGTNGRFRLEAPAGTWTLIATGFQGTAAFVHDLEVKHGSVVDVGSIYLQPCAAPGSGPNDAIYEECPDPAADGAGYGVPPAPYALDTFVPEYTDVTLVQDPGPGPDWLQVYSYGGGFSVDLQIPSDSPYFTVGVHGIAAGAGGFFATLFDGYANVMYVFREGTLRIEALTPSAGGLFRARLQDAVFDWYDVTTGDTDTGYPVTVVETNPAMSDSITVSSVVGPSGSPPPQSYSFQQLAPEFTQVYLDGDGGVWLASYDQLSGGDYVQLFLEIPAALNVPGAHPISNTLGADPSAWELELRGSAIYGDGHGSEYGYVLATGVLTVLDPATGAGDTFAATLGQASFQWQADPASAPYSTLTLSIESSGTMSATAVAPGGGNGGLGRVDWGALRTGLLVNLGG